MSSLLAFSGEEMQRIPQHGDKGFKRRETADKEESGIHTLDGKTPKRHQLSGVVEEVPGQEFHEDRRTQGLHTPKVTKPDMLCTAA